MKKIITILIFCALSISLFAKGEREVVVFDVDIHCQNCINKIEKNIAFEKGVKDLVCNLDKKQVTVVFDPEKTSVERLQKAFRDINKPATVNAEATEKESATRSRQREK